MTEDILIGKQYFPTCLCENKKYTWAWGKGLWQMDTRYTWHQNVCHKKNLVLWFVCTCVLCKILSQGLSFPGLLITKLFFLDIWSLPSGKGPLFPRLLFPSRLLFLGLLCLHKWKEVPPTGIFTYTNKQKVPSTYLFTTTRTLIRELRVLESFFFHTSSLLNHSRFQHQLDKFTNEATLSVAIFIIPSSI